VLFSFLDEPSDFLPTFMSNFLVEFSAMRLSGPSPTFLTAHTPSFFNTHRSLFSFISQQIHLLLENFSFRWDISEKGFSEGLFFLMFFAFLD
jgi:hypothetical protein